VLIIELDDSTDARGLSVSILKPHLDILGGPVEDVHIGEIQPGAIRGNHYHVERKEIIAVAYSDAWSLHWDTGEGSTPQHRYFDGSGGLLAVPPNMWSHAVRNDGSKPLWIIALSDREYNRHDSSPLARDAITRIVTTDATARI
jgi:oxalate decarboxylase/phosphoglucose isomerase-like protein (cupin superfamily)